MPIIPSLPVDIQNGTPEDADEVMANFNQIVEDVNANAAASGANSDITSLTGLTTPIPVSEGGTGAVTAPDALTNLGAAASGANSDITSLTGLTTPIPVSEGGTGVTSITAGALLSGSADPPDTIEEIAVGNEADVLTVVSGKWQAAPITRVTGLYSFVYLNNGTFTNTSTDFKVTLVGGGGGGLVDIGRGGGGGGAGGACIKWFHNVPVGSNFFINIGAGGGAGAVGAASTFSQGSAILTAGGGASPGPSGISGAGAPGGSASGGDINIIGGGGQGGGLTGGAIMRAGGGNSLLGGGGLGGLNAGASAGAANTGGGGGCNAPGGSGICIVEYIQ